MSLTWNIVSKDLLRMRTAILAWAGLMVLKVLLYAAVSGSFGPPSVAWLLALCQGPVVVVRAVLEPLVAFVLVGWLVHEDPLAGSDAFWVTRPISGSRLMGAKVVVAAALFVVLPILIDIPWWLSCGFGIDEISHAAVPVALEYGSIAVVGLGVASVTTSFPRYFLWTIVGMAGLVAVHLMAADISSTGLGFQNTQAIGTSIAITRVIVLFSCMLLLCAEIGVHQFLSRHFRKSLVLVMALTLLASTAVFCTHLDFFPGFGWSRQGYGTPMFHDSVVAMRLPLKSAAEPRYDSYMFVPLKLTGLAPGMSAFWQAQAEWSAGGKTIWKVGGIGGRYQYDLMQERIRGLLGFSRDTSDFACGENFQFPRSIAEHYAGKTLSFHSTFYIYLLKGHLVADKPVAEQSFKSSGSSFWITNLVKGEKSVTATITDRFERINPMGFLGAVWPRDTTWALVDRPKGKMQVGQQDFGGEVFGLQLNMVTVVVERMKFPASASPTWLNVARLVGFDFEGDRNVEQDLDDDAFRYTYVSAADSRYNYKNAH